jgi:hypothetical protein
MRGNGVRERSYVAREAQMLAASLTFEPASHEARPLRWRPGDIRERVDRSRWPLSWRTDDPLMRRAVEYGWTLRTRTASRIVDRRFLDDVPLAPGAVIPAAPTGELRHAASARGSVLR